MPAAEYGAPPIWGLNSALRQNFLLVAPLQRAFLTKKNFFKISLVFNWKMAFYLLLHAALPQLIEDLIMNQGVIGPNPIRRTT